MIINGEQDKDILMEITPFSNALEQYSPVAKVIFIHNGF